jgi:hypothetical protein
MTKRQRAIVSAIVVTLLTIGCTISSLFGRFEVAVVFVVATIFLYFVAVPWMRRGAPNEPPRPT